MPESSELSFFRERKFFADRLSIVSSVAPVSLASLIIGTILWAVCATTINPYMVESWSTGIGSWLAFNIMFVALPTIVLSYPFCKMVDSSFCVLVNSISNFKNIPLFTESPKLNILLLMYGYRIRKFVSGGAIADLVIDDRIKLIHKKVEDILSEPAVVDVIKKGKSKHFKKDVVVSVAKVIKIAIQEVYEISRNVKIEAHNKARKQNEESEQMVAEFLTRKK